MKLIIGLGNPGKEYIGTRHNVGFSAVDVFAEDFDGKWTKDAKRKALVSKTTVGKTPVVLAKPTTFMNLSGEAVQALISFYKVKPEDILIVQDDLDLKPGRFKFAAAGSSGGHKGIESIYEQLGALGTKIARFRIGIGHPKDESANADTKSSAAHPKPVADFVLGPLSPEDAPNALDTSSAMRDWIEGGLERASNKWNRTSGRQVVGGGVRDE
jgi:peptidyl-tRNA hydrolase, PTH1 family